ncbi:DUF6059 family protein [Streptomyces sp. NPDC001985]|uniref:DUF6059 family protein n=1 Tax=Streptomyces sp. NPDC001985 TaxID=3154406 RepID=UPI0033208F24
MAAASGGWSSVRRALRRLGKAQLRGFASLAAMFGVLPAEPFRDASRGWLAPERDGRARRDGQARQERQESQNSQDGQHGQNGGGPPPAHPERLIPQVPPTPGERALWAQLEDPGPGA